MEIPAMKFFFFSSFAHLALDRNSHRVSGGAELQVALLGKALAQLGHEVVFMGSDMPGTHPRLLEGVRLLRGGHFHTGSFLDTALAFPRVLNALAREKPDCVLILGWTTWLYFFLQLRSIFKFRLAFICGLDTEINGEFRRAYPIRGALFEKAVQAADLRFAMSGYQEMLFQKRNMKCSLYRNLILPRTLPRTIPKDIDLLWVARCQPIKQPHRFLDLVEKLPDTKCQMICPRENVALWESVRKRAQKLPHLTFLEKVPYHQIQEHYDAAKIFVNTSVFEGWPNSFIQSGLASTALLSLNINPDGLFEKYFLGKCAHGEDARLVEFAHQMLADPEALSNMQKGSEDFVAQLHDNETNVRLFLEGLQSDPRLQPSTILEQMTNSYQIGIAALSWCLL
jgi:glycosyltransferase involved in cell wall biosynthesis